MAMRGKWGGLAATLVCAASVLVASCGGSDADRLVGLVTDVAGINDRSFNATAWKGVQDAQRDGGVVGLYRESSQSGDYALHIQALIEQQAALVVTVGFLLSDATRAAALAHPEQAFAIVDVAYDPPLPNVLGLTFRTDEAAFLAGYLAAGMSQSGKVGTFGGVLAAPVTNFMVGFESGVRYYNQRNGQNVAVLGWQTDPTAPGCGTGWFVGNFESAADGQRLATELMDEGADVVFPVAGALGAAAAAVVQARGKMVIGVDNDQYFAVPEYRGAYLTSVLKHSDQATYAAIQAVVQGRFQGGTYVGTLQNGGVGLAPWHDFESRVPATLQADIEQIRQALVAGQLTMGWERCVP